MIKDERTEENPVPFEFEGELTLLQKQAAQALLEHDTGVVVAPPGTGKTVLGTYLVGARARNTLVLVHRRPLLDQWVAQLSMFLGVAEREVGQIGGGRRKPNGRLDVGMLQSLVRGGQVADCVATYGQVIVDECHHVPASSFERVLAEVKARYIVGLTATPHRRDGLHPILEMQLGPVRFAVDRRSQVAQRPFRHLLVVRETDFRLSSVQTDLGIQELYRALATDDVRNTLIIDDVIGAVEDGRCPIFLTGRRDHLEFFADRLQGVIKNLVVLRGGMTARERREIAERLGGISDKEERVILATGRYIGEGFDDSRLDTLFLAMPISWKGTLVQYAGRLHRLNPRKEDVRIFDYVDREVPLLLRMFEKRLRAYRAIGYSEAAGDVGEEGSTDQMLAYDDGVEETRRGQ